MHEFVLLKFPSTNVFSIYFIQEFYTQQFPSWRFAYRISRVFTALIYEREKESKTDNVCIRLGKPLLQRGKIHYREQFFPFFFFFSHFYLNNNVLADLANLCKKRSQTTWKTTIKKGYILFNRLVSVFEVRKRVKTTRELEIFVLLIQPSMQIS